MNGYYLGIDVGSVSTNIVLIDEQHNIIEKLYLRTSGQPIKAIREGLKIIAEKVGSELTIQGIGTTGSGRQLAGIIAGADVIKNEITTHAVAAQRVISGVKTVMEIGGQDSKIIILKNGIVNDFAMNSVCAAGTGSFLDRQAERLGIQIQDFGSYAIKASSPVRIAGRCAVFAESDMIHKQQTGHGIEDIIAGLCEALVRNYLNNLAKGKNIQEPVVFQGGVAANIGIVKAFEKALGMKVIIPQHYEVMGAFGAAILSKEGVHKRNKTAFRGFKCAEYEYKAKSFDCCDCANSCEILEIISNKSVLSRWGDKCGKWSGSVQKFPYSPDNELEKVVHN